MKFIIIYVRNFENDNLKVEKYNEFLKNEKTINIMLKNSKFICYNV